MSDEHLHLMDVRKAKAEHGDHFLKLNGVIGVGVGYRHIGGKATREFAVVVLVQQKHPKESLSPEACVPPTIRMRTHDGTDTDIPTDVQVMSGFTPAAHVTTSTLRTRLRPVPGGAFISSSSGGGGTLGGWVWDRRDGELSFLSNEHVLGSVIGATVNQPFFPMPGDTTDYSFGQVTRASNQYDATIGIPNSGDEAKLETFGGGPAIFETAIATMGMAAEKTGARTGHTEGTVDMIDVSTSSPCHRSRTAFRIQVTGGGDFSQPGDSGSVVFERVHPEGSNWKRALGLLYCQTTDGTYGFAHQIEDVFADLGLTTICEALAPLIDIIFNAILEGLSSASFSRDMERRMMSMSEGRYMVETIHTYRPEIVKVLLDGDGHRAFQAALAPLLKGGVTTDEVIARTLDEADIERWNRFLTVAERIAPELGRTIQTAREYLHRAQEVCIADVLAPSQSE